MPYIDDVNNQCYNYLIDHQRFEKNEVSYPMEWLNWLVPGVFGVMWIVVTIIAIYTFYVGVYQRKRLFLSVVMGVGFFITFPMMVIKMLTPQVKRAVSEVVVDIVERSYRNLDR